MGVTYKVTTLFGLLIAFCTFKLTEMQRAMTCNLVFTVQLQTDDWHTELARFPLNDSSLLRLGQSHPVLPHFKVASKEQFLLAVVKVVKRRSRFQNHIAVEMSIWNETNRLWFFNRKKLKLFYQFGASLNHTNFSFRKGKNKRKWYNPRWRNYTLTGINIFLYRSLLFL